MRQRRRAERGRLGARLAQTTARRINERTQQRFLLWGAAALGVVLVLLLGGGWLFTSYLPARETVAEVDGREIQVREILPYTVLDASFLFGGRLFPETSLSNYVRDIILRNHAEGFSVSEEEINKAIASNFDPDFDPEAPPPDTLNEATRNAFENFLDAASVSEPDYRGWAEGRLLQEAGLEHYASLIPEETEQVFVNWIIAPSPEEASAAADRIRAGESFATVSADVNIDTFYADENGEVGWVPEGAVPEMDPYLFGEEAKYGELVGPLDVQGFGNVVLRIDEPPTVEPVTDEMRDIMGRDDFQTWMNERVEELVSEDAGLTREQVQWVFGQFT